MLKSTINKMTSLRNSTDDVKVMYTYRFFSWLFTSIFYLALNSTFAVLFSKLVAVISLFIFSVMMVGLYEANSSSRKVTKLLVLVEIIGITLLLIPTGGLESPFIWYALNPVLVAASFLSSYFCWMNLAFYITSSTIISYLLFNPDRETIKNIISSNPQLVLIFILITMAMQLLSKQTRELRRQKTQLIETNEKLNRANIRIQESMEQIKSLYQTVEAFTGQNNINELIYNFAQYTQRITKSSLAFFWIATAKEYKGSLALIGDEDEGYKDKIAASLEDIWSNISEYKRMINIEIENEKYLVSLVRSTSIAYGLVGIRIDGHLLDDFHQETMNQISFVAELSAVILERIQLEEVEDSLILVEEQNRIANEMHDSVSQRLFSISCSIYTLLSNWKNVPKAQLEEQLISIKDSANKAMKELRAAIYRLSSRKRGEKVFEDDIREYLDNISKLNNVSAEISIIGDEELLSSRIKRSLYRIICEGIGNAVRHGKCSSLKVDMNINREALTLKIEDDGRGFAIDEYEKVPKGLGLKNIHNLVKSLNGDLELTSKNEQGTTVNIKIPNPYSYNTDQEGLAI